MFMMFCASKDGSFEKKLEAVKEADTLHVRLLHACGQQRGLILASSCLRHPTPWRSPDVANRDEVEAQEESNPATHIAATPSTCTPKDLDLLNLQCFRTRHVPHTCMVVACKLFVTGKQIGHSATKAGQSKGGRRATDLAFSHAM